MGSSEYGEVNLNWHQIKQKAFLKMSYWASQSESKVEQ